MMGANSAKAQESLRATLSHCRGTAKSGRRESKGWTYYLFANCNGVGVLESVFSKEGSTWD